MLPRVSPALFAVGHLCALTAFSPAAPTAVDDTYSIDEDGVLVTAPTPLVQGDFNTNGNVVAGPWDYLDTLENGLGAGGIVNGYPVDGAGRSWKALNFDLNTSRDAANGNMALPWNEPSAGNPTGGPVALPMVGGAAGVATPVDGLPTAPKVLEGFGGGTNSQNTVTTYLFRKVFTLDAGQAAISSWVANVLVDDGIVIYINGVEVGRHNMDPANFTPSGTLGTATSLNVTGNETVRYDLALNLAGILNAGSNIIAIELHNANNGGLMTSGDIGLDLTLTPNGLDGFSFVEATQAVPLFGVAINDRTQTPQYMSGDFQAAGGTGAPATGGLRVEAGHRPPLGPPSNNRSSAAGFRRTFVTGSAGIAHLSFDYRLLLRGDVDSGENGEIRCQIDGVDIGTGANAYVHQMLGVGAATNPQDSGWLSFAKDVMLNAGSHTLTVGVFSNRTTNDGQEEYAEAFFDNVTLLKGAQSVLENDTGGPVTAQLVAPAAHGTVNLDPDGTFTYTPDANYHGTDTFTYRASDGTDLSNLATVTITINSVDDSPVAANDAYTATEDILLTVSAVSGVKANDSDADGDVLSVILVQNVAHGTLSLAADGSFTYLSAANYSGPDFFSYKLSDGQLESGIVVVNLTVDPANDLPAAANDTYKVAKNGSLVITNPNGTAVDEALILGTERDAANLPTTPGSLWSYWDQGELPPGTGTNWRKLVFDESAWKVGPSELGYGDGPEGSDTFPQVTMIEDNPTAGYAAASDRYWTAYFRKVVNITNVAEITGVSLQVMRDDGIVLTINETPVFRNGLASNNPPYTEAATGGSPSEKVFLNAASLGSAENQNWLASAPSPSVFVEGDNIVAAEVHQQTQSSSDLSFDVKLTVTRLTNKSVLKNDIDFEGDPMTASLVAGPAHGSLTLNADGTFSYTPDTDYLGTDTFTYRASDGTGDSNVATVSLVVANLVNQKPAAVADSYAVNEDATLTVTAASGVLDNDNDPDGDEMTAILVGNVTKGVLTLNADGSFTYTPNGNYFGTDSFTYKVRDSQNNESPTLAIVTLTVTSVNDVPVAVSDSFASNPGQELTVSAPGILANDTDVETASASLTTVLVTGPAGGTFSLNPNGSFSFTPPGIGVFTFTYRASDGTANSAIATVTMVINGIPVAAADSYSLAEDGSLVISAPGLLQNDSDPENSPLTAVAGTNPANGTVTISSNGAFTYTPNANFAGIDTFTYKANDGSRESLPGVVSITVTPVPDAPVAANDSYTAPVDSSYSVEAAYGVLSNDSDPDAGALLTATLVQTTAHGELIFNADGSFTYTPATGYTGTDSFSYRVSDGTLTSGNATVAMSVSGTNEVVVISEIMFNPASKNEAEEYIEIHNTAPYAVDVSNWEFSAGVTFTIPAGTVMPGNSHRVITANPAAFLAAHPGAANFLPTGWGAASSLSNSGETVRLGFRRLDGSFNTIDEVSYFEEGDWAVRQAESVGGNTGWKWVADADGLGASLQVRNPLVSNNSGQNWTSATPTPGAANNNATANLAPIISKVKHTPEIPTSTQQVYVTCELTDESATGLSASVFHRALKAADPQDAFTQAAMFDDGKHQDGLAGDGKFGVALPARANTTIVEFYVQSSDGTNTRTWPPQALNQAGTALLAQSASPNCLYQVDEEVWGPDQPIYRIIMSKVEGDAFVSASYNRSETADTDKNVTVVFRVGADADVHYRGGLRYRGAGSRGSNYYPNNWKMSLPGDDAWNGWSSFNLNSQSAHGLVLGSRLMQCAGLPCEIGTPAAVRFNGVNRMSSTVSPAPSSYAVYGRYSHQTPMGREWANYAFPANGGGNVYKKGRGNSMGWSLHETSPGVPDIAGYTAAAWVKQTNVTENNWTDLNNFIKTIRSATSNATSPPTINFAQANTVANLDQWARWWAFCTIINHRETNLSNGVDDDYSVYFGPQGVPGADARCHLLAHDFDTILGSVGDTSTPANATIWQAYDTNFLGEKSFAAAGLDIPQALFYNNTFCRMFKWHLRDLLGTVFTQANFNALVENTWSPGNWVPQAVRDTVKTFMNSRRAYVASQVPSAFTAVSSHTPVGGVYTTTDPNDVGLSGAIDGAMTADVLVNGLAAPHSNHDNNWNSGGVSANLKPGYNTVLVQAMDAGGKELFRQSFVYFYDDGSVQNVSANIAANATWTAVGGPYNITTDVTIGSGATLTIEPGTTVYFAAGASLAVASGGRLLAEGLETAPIRFMQASGVAVPWDGILIQGGAGSPQSRLSWAIIEKNNLAAIRCIGSDVSLDHITFANPAMPYLELAGASFVVSNTEFPAAAAAFPLILGTGGIRSGGQGSIRSCTFGVPSGNSDVIDFTGGNRPGEILHVQDCVFNGATDDMLDIDGTDAWIEGNAFLHCHRNGATDSSAVISAGSDGANTSQITAVRNLFYDIEQACTLKAGSSCALLHNTIVRSTATGGTDTAVGVLNFSDTGAAPFGGGAYLEGNIIWDIQSLTRNYSAAQSNVVLVNNLLPSAWSGPGSGNVVVADPKLNLAAITTPSTANEAVVRAAFALQPCSPAVGAGRFGSDCGGLIAPGLGVSGIPLGATSSTSLTVMFGPGGSFSPTAPNAPWGFGFTAYRYSVDGGPLSAEIPIGTAATLTGLATGVHTISMLGKTDAGIWQETPTISCSWTVNPAASGVLIWEVLSDNRTAYSLGSTHPDYIELHNPGGSAVNLSGFGLSDNAGNPQKYVFPASATIPAGGFLLVICDSLPSQAGELHAGFGLDSGGETPSLFAPGAVAGAAPLDSVALGPQLPDKSVGRATGSGIWGVGTPTPGAVNLNDCDFGSAATVRINEWLAATDITIDTDFIELYNPAAKPVIIGGMMLTDDQSNLTALRAMGSNNVFTIPALSYIPAGGFVRFIADGDEAASGDHTSFKLSSFHNGLGLADAAGRLVDHVILPPANVDVSTGRNPDGNATYAAFVLPTPGFSNTTDLTAETGLLNNLRITEIMFAPPSGKAEYLEFQNVGTSSLTVTGVALTNGVGFTFPAMTIPAGGYAVITDSLAKFNAQFPGVTAMQWTAGDKLKNEGENLRFEIPLYGLGILDFDYDTWYPETVGGGATLQIIDPLGARDSWTHKESWQPGFPSPGAAPAFGALAGLDVSVVLPATGVLDGSVFYGAFDPIDVTVTWSKVSGPGAVSFAAPNSPDTDATFSATGSYVLRLTATGPGGAASSDDVSVTVLEGFAAWIAGYYPGNSNPAVVGEDADPDHDGISNLIEFAMALHPAASSTHLLPAPTVESDHLVLTYRRRVNAPGVTYLVEASDDMAAWDSGTVSDAMLTDDGTVQVWRAEDGIPTSGTPRRFMRVRVIPSP